MTLSDVLDTDALPVSMGVIREIARQAERAHANVRITTFHEMRGVSLSAAASRNAHLTDLALFLPYTFRPGSEEATWDALWWHLRHGTLLNHFGGHRDGREGECFICSRTGPVILAKRHPKDLDAFAICLSETSCIPLTGR